MIRIMGTSSNMPTTENLCAMVTKHAGAGAEVRSKVGYFLERTPVSTDKAIQNRSREHSLVVGLTSGMCLGNTCAWLGILG